MTENNPPWYQGVEGFDSAAIGQLQNKGWDKLEPPKAAAAIFKAYSEAEKHIGAPSDQILRLPKDRNDATAMREVFQKLGTPAKPEEYDFTGLKNADGSAPDQKFVDFFRGAAHKAGIPSSMAAQLAAEFVKFTGDASALVTAETKVKIEGEKATLKKNWGNNEVANTVIAKRAAEALGVGPEEMVALEGQIGYARVMEMMRNIGSKIGEDKFVTGNSGDSAGKIVSRDQANARLKELMDDKPFVTRYMSGDTAAKREMDQLHRIIAGAID